MGFKLMNLVLKKSKTVYALNLTATVIGNHIITVYDTEMAHYKITL